MRYLKLLCVLMAALSTTSGTYAQRTVTVQDSLALVDFYNATNGPNWVNNEGWLEGPVNTWYGVGVEDGRVNELQLINGNQLIGAIPESFGNLTNLDVLRLNNNGLTSLPASLGKLTNLLNLSLGQNKLRSLPESIGNLTKLVYLSLENNQLSALPESIGGLVNLQSSNLAYNQLSSLPESFGNMNLMRELHLNNNHLRSLPESFGMFTRLLTLYLSDNQLTSFPESFGRMKNLGILSSGNNQLSSLPESFGNLAKLAWLELENNQLSSLPESFGNLTMLFHLNLSHNQLSSLPDSFVNLISLSASHAELYLDENKLTFAELEWILKAFPSNVSYVPQDTFKLKYQGIIFIARVGGTPQNNTFYWYRDDILETTIKADSTYTPTQAGNYRVEVTNAVATQLRLKSSVIAYTPGLVTLNCAPDTTVEAGQNESTAMVSGIDPNIMGATIADVMYTLSGATTGSGSGTASGQLFNKGVTTVTYTLSNDASVNCAFTVMVEDYNAHPVVNITDVTIYESDGKAKVMVHIERPTTVPLRLSFKTVAGTATAHGPMKDYTSRVGYVKIRPGMTSGKIRIPVRKDTRTESDETFYVVIRKKGFREDISVVGRDTALVTIRDGNRDPEMSVVSEEIVAKKSPVSIPTEPTALLISASPNPSKGPFRITISGDSRQVVDLTITNALGMKVDTKRGLRAGQTIEIGKSYQAGTYFVTARTGTGTTTITLIRQ